ncbi:MAG TPA: dTDP-4-dehydrorhamnose reductase [Xanthomonadales bacterium]|nr:dTDP-4-dehydrorhamnose reductase [Xanthomonadales bacterium]
MSVLLLGADGQVGFELHRLLPSVANTIATTRIGVLPGVAPCRALDLAVPGAAAALIAEVRPRWVVNAAAYTAVDRAEDEPALAQRVNGDALGEIGNAARAVGARVLHFSTDYVFSGEGTRPWREDDATGPRNAYGRSKLAGEQALAASGCQYLLLRTAWVYGARGRNFLRTMLKLGRDRDELSVVADQRGTPTSSRAIAAGALACMLRADAGSDVRWGTYHLSCAGESSWHEFATAIFAGAAHASLLAKQPTVHAIASAAYPTRAIRPAWSVLDCTRVAETFGVRLPAWREALDLVLGELAEQERDWGRAGTR